MLAPAADWPNPGVFQGIFTGPVGIKIGEDYEPSVKKPSLAISEGILGCQNPQLLPLVCRAWLASGVETLHKSAC